MPSQNQRFDTQRRPVLLTVSGVVADDIQTQIDNGRRPRADYLAIAEGLSADTIDYRKARSAAGWIGAVLKRLGGDNLALAYACWQRRHDYQAIVTDGEQVGLLLALLFKLSWGFRPRHVMITHVISVPKKQIFLDWLGVQSCIDHFIVYCTWQKQFIEHRWRMAPQRVHLVPFMVDDAFFAAERVAPAQTQRPQICAVGLERRDYPTLLQAVADLDVQVVIAAASPWSKGRDSTSGHSIPDHVTVRKFSQFELRQVYADSRFMVMPLEPVNFQAGITAILEAMAMSKPVICSRVPGQTDVVIDGVNGRYVAPGDAAALRSEIQLMLADPAAAATFGANGRRQIEHGMNLDHYVTRLADIVMPCLGDRRLQATENSAPIADAWPQNAVGPDARPEISAPGEPGRTVLEGTA